MILIGLGSNLSDRKSATPRLMLEMALVEMAARGIDIVKQSHFYESEPVPKSDQPWFVNAVVAVETIHSPEKLLETLHDIEAGLGRRRRIRWEARIIDLDILTFHDHIYPSPDTWPARDVGHAQNCPTGDGTKANAGENEAQGMIIPHPRLHERLFVLKPLMDICPDWTHPVSGKTAKAYASQLTEQAKQGMIRLI